MRAEYHSRLPGQRRTVIAMHSMDAWLRRRGRHRVVASAEKSRKPEPMMSRPLVSQGVAAMRKLVTVGLVSAS